MEVVMWVFAAMVAVAVIAVSGLVVAEEVRFRRWLREEQDRMRGWLEGFDDDKR